MLCYLRLRSERTELKYLEQAGNGPAYQVMVSVPEGAARTSLFSLHPFDSHKWVTRAPSHPERSALLGLLSSASEYKEAIDTVQSADIGTIDSPTRAWTLFIVPWKTEVDEEGTSNQKSLVISAADDHYKVAGEFSGSLGSFVDIDADGAPEVQVSESCDGICEYVVLLYPAIKVMVSILAH